MGELTTERIRIWDESNSRPEEPIAMMLHFYLTWASRGSFNANGAAAQACARLHDSICAFNSDVPFERVSLSFHSVYILRLVVC